jgi:hypothetical protein
MSRYFFHLAGGIAAHDLLGRDFPMIEEAKAHARALALGVGTDKPGLIDEQNYISVVNKSGEELFRQPLVSNRV